MSADPKALSPEMAALAARVLAEDGPQPDPTLLPAAEGREAAENGNRRWNIDLPPMAHTAEVEVAAIDEPGQAANRMRVLVPEGAGKGAVLFVHGGGFAFCSPETHERCARVLAVECGLPVLVPDYRLAPENPWPAGLMDVVACLRGAFDATAGHGVQTGPLILAGDSAGANLALAAMLHEQAAGRPPVAGALLFYGTYGMDFTTQSYSDFAEGPGLTRGKMQRYWRWYAGAVPEAALAADPLACPLVADDAQLAALPPLHLMAAGVDPLLSDTLLLHARLEAIGRAETVSIVPGVTHGFLQNTHDLAAAREALHAAAMAARRMVADA